MPLYQKRFQGQANNARYRDAAYGAAAATARAPGYRGVNTLMEPGTVGRVRTALDEDSMLAYQMRMQDEAMRYKRAESERRWGLESDENARANARAGLELAEAGYDVPPSRLGLPGAAAGGMQPTTTGRAGFSAAGTAPQPPMGLQPITPPQMSVFGQGPIVPQEASGGFGSAGVFGLAPTSATTQATATVPMVKATQNVADLTKRYNVALSQGDRAAIDALKPQYEQAVQGLRDMRRDQATAAASQRRFALGQPGQNNASGAGLQAGPDQMPDFRGTPKSVAEQRAKWQDSRNQQRESDRDYGLKSRQTGLTERTIVRQEERDTQVAKREQQQYEMGLKFKSTPESYRTYAKSGNIEDLEPRNQTDEETVKYLVQNADSFTPASFSKAMQTGDIKHLRASPKIDDKQLEQVIPFYEVLARAQGFLKEKDKPLVGFTDKDGEPFKDKNGMPDRSLTGRGAAFMGALREELKNGSDPETAAGNAALKIGMKNYQTLTLDELTALAQQKDIGALKEVERRHNMRKRNTSGAQPPVASR